MIAPAVGGGFGSKLNVYPEEAICLAVARRLGRPVKWIEERTENYIATIHGRGVLQEMELAATAEGKVTAVRARLTVDFGAYYQLVTPGIPLLGAFLYGGVYDVQGYFFECTGAFTNKTPTDAYRGAGRPEATYAIERAMDALARRLGKDPAEIRRLNFIPAFDEPTGVASGLQYDSGHYEETFDHALRRVDYEGLRREQAERRERGDTKQLGIGLSSYIEMCGLAPSQVLAALSYGAGGWDAATVRCHPTGKVTVVTGTSPHGQGHATTWAQIAADELGVPFEDVEVLHGDTAVSPLGMDTYGSRSLSVGGVALWNAPSGSRRRRGRLPHTSSRSPRTTSSSPTARSASGAFPTGRRRSPRSPTRPGPPTTCHRTSSPGSRRPTSSTRPTSRSRRARTCAPSRSTPRPVRSAFAPTSRSTTAGTSSIR